MGISSSKHKECIICSNNKHIIYSKKCKECKKYTCLCKTCSSETENIKELKKCPYCRCEYTKTSNGNVPPYNLEINIINNDSAIHPEHEIRIISTERRLEITITNDNIHVKPPIRRDCLEIILNRRVENKHRENINKVIWSLYWILSAFCLGTFFIFLLSGNIFKIFQDEILILSVILFGCIFNICCCCVSNSLCETEINIVKWFYVKIY